MNGSGFAHTFGEHPCEVSHQRRRQREVVARPSHSTPLRGLRDPYRRRALHGGHFRVIRAWLWYWENDDGRGGFRTCDLSRVNTIASTGGREKRLGKADSCGVIAPRRGPVSACCGGCGRPSPTCANCLHSRSSSSKKRLTEAPAHGTRSRAVQGSGVLGQASRAARNMSPSGSCSSAPPRPSPSSSNTSPRSRSSRERRAQMCGRPCRAHQSLPYPRARWRSVPRSRSAAKHERLPSSACIRSMFSIAVKPATTIESACDHAFSGPCHIRPRSLRAISAGSGRLLPPQRY